MSIDTYPQVDPAITQAFMGRVLGDSSACMVTAMAALGDRLGLFKALAIHGASTADEVAAQSGTQARYVREWLGGMAAAGYIRYEPASEQFSLPAEHAAVLAEEGGGRSSSAPPSNSPCPNSSSTTASRKHSDPAAESWNPRMRRICGRVRRASAPAGSSTC